MSTNKSTRATLKSYFQTNDVPTQDQYGELIDSMVNQTDDGITITEDNFVGIGTDTPSSKLTIKGNTHRVSLGSVSASAGSAVFTGTNTRFKTLLKPNAVLSIDGTTYTVASIQSDTQFTATAIVPTTQIGGISGDATIEVNDHIFSIWDQAAHAIMQVDQAGKTRFGTDQISSETLLEVNGTLQAAKFEGDGSGLTNVPFTAPAQIAASKLTGDINLPLNNIAAKSFTGDGSGLTHVPLSPTAHVAGSQLTGDINLPSNSVSAQSFHGDGSGLTNVPFTAPAQIAASKLTGDINLPLNNIAAKSFTGDGSGLTNVPFTIPVQIAASKLTGDINLPANTISAKSFQGDGSQLTGIKSAGNPVSLNATPPILTGGVNTVQITCQVEDGISLDISYPHVGQVINKKYTIEELKSQIVLNAVINESTTFTFLATSNAQILFRQIHITLIPDVNQYAKQLWGQGFSTKDIVTMSAKKFKLETTDHASELATAVTGAGASIVEVYLVLRQFYVDNAPTSWVDNSISKMVDSHLISMRQSALAEIAASMKAHDHTQTDTLIHALFHQYQLKDFSSVFVQGFLNAAANDLAPTDKTKVESGIKSIFTHHG